MTAREYLDLQEKRTLRSLQDNVTDIGHDLRTSVDLPALVQRHPTACVVGGIVGGWMLGKLLTSGGRRVASGVVGTMIRPLFKPTLAGLGTAIAGLIVGSPIGTSDP